MKNSNSQYNLITILGPTANGKTAFATKLALMLDTEIISADSRQVYRGMDIGTGKDIAEYTISGKKIPYHLIDIVDAGEKYNVFRFQKDFFESFQNILSRNKTPIMCGGTGLYLEAIIKNYNLIEVPENKPLRLNLEKKSLKELELVLKSMKKTHNTTEFDTKKRAIRAIEIETYIKNNPQKAVNYPNINSLLIGVKHQRQIERERITARLKQRLDEGMIDEVKKLMEKGVPKETLIYYGLEYKFITLFLTGEISYDEMFAKLNTAIHQFAKRQRTWFRRMERNGLKIDWFTNFEEFEKSKLCSFLNSNS